MFHKKQNPNGNNSRTFLRYSIVPTLDSILHSSPYGIESPICISQSSLRKLSWRILNRTGSHIRLGIEIKIFIARKT